VCLYAVNINFPIRQKRLHEWLCLPNVWHSAIKNLVCLYTVNINFHIIQDNL
jgi:hypothetical protein